jgi:ribonuclease Z
MRFNITILGSGAAIPTIERNPSAQLIEFHDRLILVDCGEGTQVQLKKFGNKPQRINHIFISHLHGDHYFGLIGLLTSLHLLGRQKEMHIYSIPALKEIIDLQLLHSNTSLIYSIIFHSIDPYESREIMDDEQLSVTTIPLNHRVPTCGFLFREKPLKRKISKDFAGNHRIPYEIFEKIRLGEDYVDEDGIVYKNKDITVDPPKSRSYAYCTDTAYNEDVIPIIEGVDLLYHEATFMQDKVENAHEKFHSTALEAATIALKANVRQLMLGHYSARYKDTDSLLNEAKQVFPNTILAEDGRTIEIHFQFPDSDV